MIGKMYSVVLPSNSIKEGFLYLETGDKTALVRARNLIDGEVRTNADGSITIEVTVNKGDAQICRSFPLEIFNWSE